MPDEIRVQDEQGTIHVFPDGSTPEMIAKVMNVKPPSPEAQVPDAVAQARQVIQRIPERVYPLPISQSIPADRQRNPSSEKTDQMDAAFSRAPQLLKAIRKGALTAAGGSFGGEFGALAKGLPWFLRAVAGASGAGFGAGAGNLAGGGSPKEALATASQVSSASLPLEGLAVGLQAARPAIAQMVRDPLTGKVKTPWEMAVDKVLPDPYAPKALPAKPIPKGTNYGQFLENQKIAAANPPLGSVDNPGLMSKIPVGRSSMPKQLAPPSSPFPWASASNARSLPNPELPALPEGNPTPFPLVKSKAQVTGSAADPFEPLVWESPEEAAAHDLRMRNLQRQAKSAGTYHAAQGASGKRTNLQQRIQRKADNE